VSRSRHVPLGSVIAVALAVALLGTACGGEAKPAPGTTPTGPATSAAGTASAAPSPAAPSPATPSGDVVEIRVTVADGKVSPRPSVHKVRLGQTVRLVVTIDQADQVHVHGYDKELEVAAGRPVTLEFRADQAGSFEVETHESELRLLRLQVS
jgi:plastocyanin